MAEQSVAIFMPSLAGGGAEKMMINIARSLTEQNYEVDLVVSKAEGEWLSALDNHIRLIDLDAPDLPGYATMGSLLPLVRYLRTKRPDSFLSVLNYANVVAILAHKISRVESQLVVSERNHLSSFSQNKSAKEKVIPDLVRFTYPAADSIIAISEGLAMDLSETANIPRSEIEVIYNPAFTPDIPRKAKEDVDHHWINGDDSVVLAVGSLTPQKDFQTLIKAFAEVRKEKSAKLIILGKGKQKQKIVETAKNFNIRNHVDLPGFTSNPYSYMSKADVFALSSRWEGFGNVIVESMACGTPVVSTNCPSGPSEILDNGTYGILTPVGDASLLGEGIIKMLNNPVEKRILENRARNFSIDKISKAYQRVLFDE